MRRYLSILLAITFIISAAALAPAAERREEGNLVIEGIPEIPQDIMDRTLQYQNIRGASVIGWDAEGEGLYISTRFAETRQIHYVSKPGGMRGQITFFNEPVGGAAVCPDEEKNLLLFSKDIGGSEFYQIFSFYVDTGKYEMLTDGESRNGGVSWSNNGGRFAFYTTKRNGRDWDLHVMDYSKGVSKPVLEEGGFWFPGEWSPDDSRMLAARYVSANESYGYVIDIETGEMEMISPSEEKVSYGGAVWAKDGKGLYYTSDQGSEFKHLLYWDLGKKESRMITGEIDWDVGEFNISHDGKTLAFTVNQEGIEKLYLMDLKSGKYEQVSGIPAGRIGGLDFHPGDTSLAISISTPKTSGDAYVLDLRDHGLTRWTFSEIGGLNTESFAEPKLFHYETFDKVDGEPREIPAFYFEPPGGEKPYPVLIYIHGGPEGQYVPYFSPLWSYTMNEMGIALIAPNVRGSSGYGKTYLKMDNAYKREDSVKDIGALIEWVKKQPDLDSDRIAVYGGSYGGYMVYAAMIHYNDHLRCGIDNVGISNFVTFLENTKEYRRDLRRVEYGDERDPEMREFLQKISPTTSAHKITKPMFIIQGLNDPRVPASEAEQMLAAIRKNGGDAWYLLAKDEGHGFRKKSNRDYMAHAVVMFLKKYLVE